MGVALRSRRRSRLNQECKEIKIVSRQWQTWRASEVEGQRRKLTKYALDKWRAAARESESYNRHLPVIQTVRRLPYGTVKHVQPVPQSKRCSIHA